MTKPVDFSIVLARVNNQVARRRAEAAIRKANESLLNAMTHLEQRVALEKKIAHLAHHDMLTGLPNRFSFDEKLNAARQFARIPVLSSAFCSSTSTASRTSTTPSDTRSATNSLRTSRDVYRISSGQATSAQDSAATSSRLFTFPQLFRLCSIARAVSSRRSRAALRRRTRFSSGERRDRRARGRRRMATLLKQADVAMYRQRQTDAWSMFLCTDYHARRSLRRPAHDSAAPPKRTTRSSTTSRSSTRVPASRRLRSADALEPSERGFVPPASSSRSPKRPD